MTKVTLENVRVDFPIYGAQRSLRKAIFQRAAGGIIRHEGKNQERIVVRALDDVSLKLEEGDRLGLMGHNGSGKSTLLKVIAGIYEPVAGRMTIEGRVTPLFDMLPGLDMEDTGYENIFTAGMLLGMSRDYLESKIPEIEEFCELGEYLTLPVRTYSAGMTLRLGFAVVTALEPGILLMDEGFGTGDTRFAERAAARMDEFIGRSRIMVLASHSDSMIKSICNKAVLMQEGTILSVGAVDDICEQYHELIHGGKSHRIATGVAPLDASGADQPEPPRYSEDSIREVGVADRNARSSGAVRITRFLARDDSNRSRWTYLPGETVMFRIEYEVLDQVPDLTLYFRLHVGNAAAPTVITDVYEILSPTPLDPGHVGAIELTFADLKLMPGTFSIYVWLGRVDYSKSYDVIDENVALPALVIEPGIKVDPIVKSKQRLSGVVSLNYQARPCQLSGSEA
jgi:ABC-type polysaccharide/polyol phosphate transport system ATPase subunit